MNSNAIFFNKDNLVLSLPFIFVCAVYGFFKYIPVTVGVPLLLGAGLFLRTRASISQRKSSRKEIDESVIKELSAEDDRKKAKKTAKALKKERAAAGKMRRRITSESAAEDGTDTKEEGEEEDIMLKTFVNRAQKKR